jgi:hypothetical protein
MMDEARDGAYPGIEFELGRALEICDFKQRHEHTVKHQAAKQVRMMKQTGHSLNEEAGAGAGPPAGLPAAEPAGEAPTLGAREPGPMRSRSLLQTQNSSAKQIRMAQQYMPFECGLKHGTSRRA